MQAGEVLFKFVNDELLPGTDIEPKKFWEGLQQNAKNELKLHLFLFKFLPLILINQNIECDFFLFYLQQY